VCEIIGFLALWVSVFVVCDDLTRVYFRLVHSMRSTRGTLFLLGAKCGFLVFVGDREVWMLSERHVCWLFWAV